MAKGTLLVTGANGALGSAIVSKFLKSPSAKDYRVICVVRNPSTAHQLQAITKQAISPEVFEILPVDLDDLSSIRNLAADINSRVADGTLGPIRALVLNAAWQEATDECLTAQTFSKDGYESAFAINYLGNFLLVLLILQSMDGEHGRVVMISSASHDADHSRNPSSWYTEKYKVMFPDTESLAKGIVYTDGTGWDAGMRRYGASKLCLVMFMYELQRRVDLDPDLSKISIISIDPAAMGGTGLTLKSPPFIRFLTQYVIPALQGISVMLAPNGPLRPASKSADDVLRACFDTESLGERPKALFLDGSALSDSSKESHDVAKQKLLWKDSLKLAGIKNGDTVLQE